MRNTKIEEKVLDTIMNDLNRCKTTQIRFVYLAIAIMLIKDRGFNYIFWLRLSSCKNKVLSFIAKCIKHFLSTLYGIQIPTCTKIGKGFRINHGVGIIINQNAIIGNNVTIHQLTTIGSWLKNKAAEIGDNVTIGPNTCIVDNVKIGKNSIIGAGSVVVKDIPDNCIAAGNPAKVIRNLI